MRDLPILLLLALVAVACAGDKPNSAAFDHFLDLVGESDQSTVQSAISEIMNGVEPELTGLEPVFEACPEPGQPNSADAARVLGEAAIEVVRETRDSVEKAAVDHAQSGGDTAVATLGQAAFEAVDAAADGSIAGIGAAADDDDCVSVEEFVDQFELVIYCIESAPAYFQPQGMPGECDSLGP